MASENDLRYWRDVEHDQNVGGAKYVGSIYYPPVWDTLESGLPGSFVPLSVERHDDTIVGVKLYFTPDEGDYQADVFSGTILTEGYASSAVPEDATPEEALELIIRLNDGYASLTSQLILYGEVVASSDAAAIDADGAVMRGSGKTYYAWTLSPCYTDLPQTVYTETAPVIVNGSVSGSILGGSYGNVSDGVFTPTGTVVEEGYTTYSVTGNNEITYHWKEDLAVEDSTTNEEFE